MEKQTILKRGVHLFRKSLNSLHFGRKKRGRPPKKVIKAANRDKVTINAVYGIQGASGLDTNALHLPKVGFFKFDLDDLTLGDYYNMKDYYQIKTAMAMIDFTLMSLNWWVEGGTKKINEAVRWQLETIWNQLMLTVAKAFWAGFSPNVKIFDMHPSKGYLYIKELRDLSPFSCKIKIDPKDQSYNGFIQDEGNITVNTVKNGKVVQEHIHVNAQYVPPEYSWWYSFMMKEGNFYGEKLLKGAYTPWFFSQVIHLYANRYFYRFSTPLAIGKAPNGYVELSDGRKIDAQELMIQILTEIRNNSSISLPSDRDEHGNPIWDVRYLESQIRGWDFDKYLKRLDMEMARAMFLPDLVFEAGRVGSYKLGELHKNTYLMLLNAIMNDIKRFIDKYIIKQFVEYNFPPDSKGRIPIPQFKFERQGTITTPIIVDLINEMVKQGKIEATIEDIANLTGVPLREVAKSDTFKDDVKPPQDTNEEEKQQPQDENQDINEDQNDEQEQKEANMVKIPSHIIINNNIPGTNKEPSTVVLKPLDKLSADIDNVAVQKIKNKSTTSLVESVKGTEFIDQLYTIVASQVGRISEWMSKRDKSEWGNVKLGFRAKFNKVWEKYVGENGDYVFEVAQEVVKEILTSENVNMAGDARVTLWKQLSKLYLERAFSVAPELAIEEAKKLDAIISNLIISKDE